MAFQHYCNYLLSFQTCKLFILKTDRQANTSRICTKHRHLIENLNAKLLGLKMSGLHSTIPHQLLRASGTFPTPHMSRMHIWHAVMWAIFRRYMQPMISSYAIPPGMTYSDVGRLTLQRSV